MQLSSILKPEAVKVFAAASSKKRLFREIGEVAQSAYGLDPQETVDALMERESLGPTGVGHGVALPHAHLPELDRVVGVFVMLERPIDFGAVDQRIGADRCGGELAILYCFSFLLIAFAGVGAFALRSR